MAGKVLSEALASVESSLERADYGKTEVIGALSPGDVIRQGDVYLVCVTGHIDDAPSDVIAYSQFQLAPGATQGSRHILNGHIEVIGRSIHNPSYLATVVNSLVKGADMKPELIGPQFVMLGPCTLDHPEHPSKSFPDHKGEQFVTCYQRQLSTDPDRVERVAD